MTELSTHPSTSCPTTISLEYYLKSLKLPMFLKEYKEMAQQCASQNASYEQFLHRLSEQEMLGRQSKAVTQRIKKAKFPVIKTLDAFDFKAAPTLNKKEVIELANCEYIEKHGNVILLGNSGTGKTHIATSLGLAACQRGKSVMFTQATQLTHSLLEAHTEREVLKLQKKLEKVDLLIVDEMGYVPFSKTGAELLFDTLSKRYEKGSCIITSNLEFAEWVKVFGCESLTGALLDRLTHHAKILTMNGESYRLACARKEQKKEQEEPKDKA